MITIGEITNGTHREFTKLSLLDADVLLAHVFGQTREYIYSHPDKSLTKAQERKFRDLVQRRLDGEPISYLTGHKEFYGMDFIMNPDVLIPRPDTELLVEAVMKYVQDIQRTPLRIVDVGTGSGNIAVALKYHLKNRVEMLGTDISKSALHIARKNSRLHNVKVQYFQGSVLDALPKNTQDKCDIIIFNAPYLTKTESRKKALQFEPQVALNSGSTPTALYETLLQQAPEHLERKGSIFFEIGHRQADQIRNLTQRYLQNSTIEILKDLGGYDRVAHIST